MQKCFENLSRSILQYLQSVKCAFVLGKWRCHKVSNLMAILGLMLPLMCHPRVSEKKHSLLLQWVIFNSLIVNKTRWCIFLLSNSCFQEVLSWSKSSFWVCGDFLPWFELLNNSFVYYKLGFVSWPAVIAFLRQAKWLLLQLWRLKEHILCYIL